MATTGTQCFAIAMDLIDERLDDGTISASDTLSYNVKSPGIINLLQSELIKQGDLYSAYEISNKPLTNLFGYLSGFDVIEFLGTELTYEATGSVKSWYFEVDRVGTVYIDDYNGSWNTLATQVTTNTPDGFTAYKGIVTPSSGATKSRMRFTGSYYYRITNRAMFAVPFELSADIPAFRPYVKKTMPDDFKSVNEIIEEFPDRQYANTATYRWEGRRDLYMSYYFTGNIRIVYRPTPTLITALTETLQLDDITCRTILPYGLASHLMLQENPSVASYFNGRYEELKKDASKKPPSATEMINNLYGTF